MWFNWFTDEVRFVVEQSDANKENDELEHDEHDRQHSCSSYTEFT